MIETIGRWQCSELRKFVAASWLLGPLCTVLAACGGGGGSSDSSGSSSVVAGIRSSRTITSGATGTEYLLRIYAPPTSAGAANTLPVLYALDGESWFETLVGLVESSQRRMIVVAIDSSGQRSRDFVPSNTCTLNGGGNAAYMTFLRQELVPFVEANIGGDPKQRALFGHSHGGSFVLYAMFSEAPGKQTFKAYLASDSSIGCVGEAANAWEQSYANLHRELPVRLHFSYASQGNFVANAPYATTISQRGYAGLEFVAQAYSGTHSGIVPQVLGDAIPFAFRQ